MFRTPAHDYTVPFLPGMLNHALRNPDNGLAVDQIKFGRVNASLITSAHKRFKEPVIERISSFLSLLDYGLGAFRESGDLLGQQLVPQLPPKTPGQELANFASTRSVFPFDGDVFCHTNFRLLQILFP